MQYAIDHSPANGNRVRFLLRFRWLKDRDAWVDEARANSGSGVEAEVCDSRHPYVRLAQRRPEGWERTDEGVEVYRVTD